MVQVNKVFLVSGNAGQGKTTIAKNIAFVLRNFGFDVLLVDGDMRTPKLGYHVGMPLAERTIQDVLLGRLSLKDAVYHKSSGLKLLLSSLTEVKAPHPSTLLPELRRLADVIIIDTPSYDFDWYATKCDTLLVSNADFPSVLDVQRLSKIANVKGVIINRAHNDNIDLSVNNIQNLVSKPIIGVVPEDSAFREALRHSYSIVEFHPDLKASLALKHIAARLMDVEYKSPLRKVSLLAKLGLVS